MTTNPDSSTPPLYRNPLTGMLTDVDPYAEDSEAYGDDLLMVEIDLPDGTVACWARKDVDDDLIDRLTEAVEAIIGSPDTLHC